ncbi:uncharacterized protein J4E88_006139 [Alternaria novae-zelandiae]|uniref:uncharacterized protein n=1 Tax=Alternaria novae-zelandiae TaxID=430562 RepID=UPI0020C3576F|nr:uncharacterized protein J4E88_006139 [Alternaria novae-zelandiae]KAI4680247.1 hypothetical protein J4E88_006139 [Alternaria novae-zelandiae]
MLPPDFKRRNPLRVRPFQDFDDAAPPPSNTRNRLLNMVHETGGLNPTWRRKNIEAYIAPKEDDEQKPSKRKRKNKNKKTKEAKDVSPALLKSQYDLLWSLIQEGLRVGSDDHTTESGMGFATPSELTNAKEPIVLDPHQRHAIHRALQRLQACHHGTIVAYGMGIGKTLVAVGLYAVLKQDFAMHGRDWSLIDKTTLDEGHDSHEFDRKVSIQGGFLIVVQVDLIPLWEKELQVHLENPPSVIVYHGHQSWYHSTAHTADELAAVDVVITSYETLRSDYEDAMAAAASHEDFFKTPVLARSPTMVIYWRGQILDEAHKIANDKTGVNKAVNRVRPLMRLPLTGTPFLNDYTDIQSQLSLIKLAPCDDPNFFASLFLLHSAANPFVYRTLSGKLNSVLSLVLKLYSLQLDHGNIFDGETVASEIDAEYVRHDHELESWERDAQENVKQPWLPRLGPGSRARVSGNSGEDILKLIIFARVAAVHPEYADTGHGENGIVKVDYQELDDGAVEGLPLGEISKLQVLKRGVGQCGNDVMASGPCDAFVLITHSLQLYLSILQSRFRSN